MDRKSIVAIVFCSLFYFGYEYYLNQKYPNRFAKSVGQTDIPVVATPTSSASPLGLGASMQAPGPIPGVHAETPSTTPLLPQLSAEELTLENTTSRYTFSQQMGSLQQVVLKNYQNDARQGPLTLLESEFILQPVLPGETHLHAGFTAHRVSPTSIAFTRSTPEWILEHRYTIPASGYGLDLICSWENRGEVSRNLDSIVKMSEDIVFHRPKSSLLPGAPSGRPAVVSTINGKTDWEDVEKYCKDGDKKEPLFAGANQNVDLVGFDKHYFLAAVLPQSGNLTLQIDKQPGTYTTHCPLLVTQSVAQGSVGGHQKIEMAFKAWMGPKSPDLLKAYDAKLEHAVDLGFFNMISRALLQSLNFVHGLVHNWGLAIILFTIFLKFLFYPLTRQAAVSMKRMQKFNPEMNRIREKLKDDPQRQQQEIMKFMSTHKINPMKGCLPILPTIPVFFAFYRVLSTSIELRHAPFVGWIQDLSAADPYYITPLLLGGCMFVQQKLTPTTGLDKTQEKMMLIMPVVFSVMMLTLPAGLVVYMLTNTLVSIAQQRWLNRKLAQLV